MKTVTRSLLLSYSPISSDQLAELYCRRAEVVVAIYSKCVVQCYGEDEQIWKLMCFVQIWYVMQLVSLFGNMWQKYNEYISNPIWITFMICQVKQCRMLYVHHYLEWSFIPLW